MKFWIWGACLLCTFFLLQSSLAQEKPLGRKEQRKVLFVVVDGIPADVIERVHTPNLDKISKIGGYSRAYTGGGIGEYSQTPTVSAVGYNSLLTGTWAHKHNVWDNDIESPNYNYWTIFRYVREYLPNKKLAIFSTWEDNRTKLLGEGLPETGKLMLDFSYDGLERDTLKFPHDENSLYIHEIDKEVTKHAARVLKNEAPDLSWVYLQYPDDVGHRKGDGPEMDRAVQLADKQIGELFEAVSSRERGMNEEWLVIVTTDHGREEKNGKGHGGQSERERTIWISTNALGLNKYFYTSTPALVDILPSIVRYMGLTLPRKHRLELDGVPFIGELSFSGMQSSYRNNILTIQWTPHQIEGRLKIWLSQTSQFDPLGKEEELHLLEEVPLVNESLKLAVPLEKGKEYKVVLEGDYNTANSWITDW